MGDPEAENIICTACNVRRSQHIKIMPSLPRRLRMMP